MNVLALIAQAVEGGATRGAPTVERVVAGVKAAVDLSDALNGWALLVLGGTLAVVFSTSYRKPAWPYRAMFLLLLPAIGLLANALVSGSHVRQAYPPMFLRNDPTQAAADALSEVNGALTTQIWSFRIAMVIIAGWLLCYLMWWIFVDKVVSAESEARIWSRN